MSIMAVLMMIFGIVISVVIPIIIIISVIVLFKRVKRLEGKLDNQNKS